MRLENATILPIWGQVIPGNTGKSKTDIMHWDESLTMEDIFFKYPGVWDKSCDELGDMKGCDTLVYREEIQDGYARETYDDVPFLVPFIVEGADTAVIACPGGAYLSKSMDSEGADIARFLNEAGISVFVLWYRTYPYHSPLMFMDCQRAVRYVRYHAAEYGINPAKISTVGFSAGGNLCGVEAIVFGNAPAEYEGYTPDEIDQVDGSVNAVAMCYPAIDMSVDKALACIAGREVYDDLEKRRAFAEKLDMRSHLTETCPPMFLCNAMDDDVVQPQFLAELAVKARALKVSCELHMFGSGGHGFGGCVVRPGPFGIPDYSAVEQWKGLYVNWLRRLFG